MYMNYNIYIYIVFIYIVYEYIQFNNRIKSIL